MLLRGELQKCAKNSNFGNFESALYSTSVSMPLMFTFAIVKDIQNNILHNIASEKLTHRWLNLMGFFNILKIF